MYVYVDERHPDWSADMPSVNANCDAGTVEQCIDERGDFFGGLTGFSPAILTMALRLHLEALLQALLEREFCMREEVRELVRELEREACSMSKGNAVAGR